MKKQEAQRSRPRRRKPSQGEGQPQFLRPQFLRKTYHMVDTCPEDIDIARFSQEVIPITFKHNKFHSFGSPNKTVTSASNVQEQYSQLVDRIDGLSSILGRLVIGNPGLCITEDDSRALQALISPDTSLASSSSSNSADYRGKRRRIDATAPSDVGDDDFGYDDMGDDNEVDDEAHYTEEDLASLLEVLLEDDEGHSISTNADGLKPEAGIISASTVATFFADVETFPVNHNHDQEDTTHKSKYGRSESALPVAESVKFESFRQHLHVGNEEREKQDKREKREKKIVELAQQLSELIPVEAAGAESLQPLAAMVKDLPPELQGRFVDQMAAAMGARLAELANRSEGPAPVVAQLDFSKGFFSKCQAEKLDDGPGPETSTGASTGEGAIGDNSVEAGVIDQTYVRVRFCPFEGVPVDASFSQQYCVVTGLPVDLFNGPFSMDQLSEELRVQFCPRTGTDVSNYHRKQRFCPMTGKPFLPEGEYSQSPYSSTFLVSSPTVSKPSSRFISESAELAAEESGYFSWHFWQAFWK